MKTITVSTTVQRDQATVWEYWTKPQHITHWNFAAEEWHCPRAENDLQPGGTFSWRMEAKDGSMGFDYSGKYVEVLAPEKIIKQLDDNRRVTITFEDQGDHTVVTENFEPDAVDPELQKQGWQAILDQFKRYVESA